MLVNKKWYYLKVFIIYFIPSLFFFMLIFPFINDSPALDALINYSEAAIYHTKGMTTLIKNRGGSSHPPLIFASISLMFYIFGIKPLAMYVLGLILAIVTSISVIKLLKDKINVWLATGVATVIVSTPLVTVSLFYAMSEGFIIAFTLLSLLFLQKKKFLLFFILLSITTLLKQTVLPIVGILVILGLLIFYKEKTNNEKIFYISKHFIKNFILSLKNIQIIMFFSILVFPQTCWRIYLYNINAQDWNTSYVLPEIQGYNAFNIILTYPINFYKYLIFLFQNMENSFVINFLWIFSGLNIILFLFIILKNKFVLKNSQMSPYINVLFIAFIISFIYIIFVFPFPTWTIPRYASPIVVCSIISSFILCYCVNKYISLLFIVLLLPINMIANFYSIDFVSKILYNEEYQHLEQIYGVPSLWRGADKVVSSLQFAKMTSLQNTIIHEAIENNADIIFGECYDLKMDLKILAITLHKYVFPEFNNLNIPECIRPMSIISKEYRKKFVNKTVYVLHNDLAFMLKEVINNTKIIENSRNITHLNYGY